VRVETKGARMITLTVLNLRGRVRALALAGVALGLLFGGSALARGRDRIRVAKPVGAKRNAAYNVTLSGFSDKQEKAYLFVDYKPCASTFVAESGQALPREKLVWTVHGTFTRTSGWKSPVSKLDYACVYLVNPRTGQLLAAGSTRYLVH
jgi:hypothetical protein